MEKQNNRRRSPTRKEHEKGEFSIQHLLSSEAIILALSTAIGYFGAYTFERGYFKYFSIPTPFMTLNNSDMMGFFTLLFLISIVIGEFLFFMSTVDLLKRINLRGLNLFIFSMMIVSISSMLYEYSIENLVWFWLSASLLLVILLIIVIVKFLIPLFYILSMTRKIIGGLGYRKFSLKKTSLLLKITFASIKKNEIKDIIDISEFEKTLRFPIKISSVFLIVIALYYALFGIGTIAAKRQTTFNILYPNTDCVVLYSRGDSVVCSPFNRNEKEIEQVYKLVNLLGDPKLELRSEIVGPLTVKTLFTPTLIPYITPKPSDTPVPTISPTQLPTVILNSVTKIP
jgi:hypothetical protein